MIQIMDWKRRWQRGIGSSPFTATGDLTWCGRCEMAVDHETQSFHRGTTYVFRRWCLRCGLVLNRGVYDNVPILSARPLPAAAVEWTLEPGRDRR